MLESPSLETKERRRWAKAIVRSFTIGKSAGPLALMVAEGKPDPAVPSEPTKELKIDSDTTATLGDLHIAVVGAPAGAKLEKVEETAVALKLPALSGPTNFKVLVAGGGEKDKAAFDELVKSEDARSPPTSPPSPTAGLRSGRRPSRPKANWPRRPTSLTSSTA